MTLSEIENRMQEITKELDDLQKKAEMYRRINSNKDVKCANVMRLFPITLIGAAFSVGYCTDSDNEETELYRIESKIYKLKEELKDLERQRPPLDKIDAMRYCDCIVDEKFMQLYLKDIGIEQVTIFYIVDGSVRVICPDSQIMAFVTGKGISPELSIGQIIYAEK